jgi:hypothetical protein
VWGSLLSAGLGQGDTGDLSLMSSRLSFVTPLLVTF